MIELQQLAKGYVSIVILVVVDVVIILVVINIIIIITSKTEPISTNAPLTHPRSLFHTPTNKPTTQGPLSSASAPRGELGEGNLQSRPAANAYGGGCGGGDVRFCW